MLYHGHMKKDFLSCDIDYNNNLLNKAYAAWEANNYESFETGSPLNNKEDSGLIKCLWFC